MYSPAIRGSAAVASQKAQANTALARHFEEWTLAIKAGRARLEFPD